jgi:hypothetical protein
MDRNPLEGGKVMPAKKLLVFLVAIVFSLSLASIGLPAGMDELKGIVTKIEGSTISIKDVLGNERTVEIKNPEALKGIKVGDPAKVIDGIVIKEGGY